MHVENQDQQDVISRHFSDWQRVGVSRIWIEISDLDPDKPKPDPNCNFRYPDSYSSLPYSNWDTNEPQCEEMANSCVYISTASGKWKSANCGGHEAFGCEVDPGRVENSIPCAAAIPINLTRKYVVKNCYNLQRGPDQLAQTQIVAFCDFREIFEN